MVVGVIKRVHLAAADILGGNSARLVLEGDAVVDALGDQVGIALAGCVEEVELLAPAALALRLCAVVTCRLSFIALKMALSAGEAAGAGALGFALGGGIALALLRAGCARSATSAGRGISWGWSHGRCHAADALPEMRRGLAVEGRSTVLRAEH